MASDTLARPPLRPPLPRSPSDRPWATLYVLLVAALMALTGVIALTEGVTRYWPQWQQAVSPAEVQTQLQALRATPDLAQMAQFSREMAWLSAATTPERFLDSKLPDHGVYLATMPAMNRALLTSHIFLGVFCMLFGGLQFWPWLRRRHMRLHRTLGTLYVVTAPLSVLLSLAYLLVTPPHHLYTHLTGFVALWGFGLGAIASIGMALRALKQRRLHEHMGWMALSFGCLIVAPMLRLNWVFTAWLMPGIDQETLNMVTLGFMLPQCLLIAHGLMLANRQAQARPRPPAALPCVQWLGAKVDQASALWIALAAGAIALTLGVFAVGHGLSSLPGMASVMGEGLMQREWRVWEASPWLGGLFGGSLSIALALAVWQWVSGPLSRRASPVVGVTGSSMALVVSTAVAGISAGVIGWRVGIAPALAWHHGGTFYLVEGLLLTTFALRHVTLLRRGSLARLREGLVYLLAVLPAPALAAASLWLLKDLPLPADYFTSGQVHLLGSAGGSGLLALALLYSVVGQAAREHG